MTSTSVQGNERSQIRHSNALFKDYRHEEENNAAKVKIRHKVPLPAVQ